MLLTVVFPLPLIVPDINIFFITNFFPPKIYNNHFHQDFTLSDTQAYFSKMKEISSNTINNLEKKAKEHHFYRSPFTGKVRENILKIMPNVDESIIIYHFGLYECDSREARRETGERSPRIYFVLGNYGFIYILFFDPFHELNP